MEGDEPTTLPPGSVPMIEGVFVVFHATRGDWRLEFFASDGKLRRWKRQQEGGRDALERFNDRGGTR